MSESKGERERARILGESEQSVRITVLPGGATKQQTLHQINTYNYKKLTLVICAIHLQVIIIILYVLFNYFSLFTILRSACNLNSAELTV